jgi:hypothetical protein
MSCIGSIVHMTHFSDADSQRGIAHQVEAFEAATANLPGRSAWPTRPPCSGIRRRTATGCAPASSSTADRPPGCRPISPRPACNRRCLSIAS